MNLHETGEIIGMIGAITMGLSLLALALVMAYYEIKENLSGE